MIIRKLFESVEIEIDGKNSWDPQIHNKKFYDRVLRFGSLGMGESYMENWWDCMNLSELFYKILRNNLQNEVKPQIFIFPVIKAKFLNLQRKQKSMSDVGYHYNKGNLLFQNMLDKRFNYSCGYWKNAKTLDEAQEAKLDLICRKIGLRREMKILDIGCGWGSFIKYACEKYNVEAVGITLSKEQLKLGNEICKGLSAEIKLQDYREISGIYDRIVSIGMIEHVGYKNYGKFMMIVNNSLSDDGLFLLHTIGSNNSDMCTDPWTNKYIFPNGMLPSSKQLAEAVENKFIIEDWHNFGFDYSKTLDAWYQNFNKNWKSKLSVLYDNKFYRMWKYYLQSCSGSFRARYNQLWQLVLSKNGIEGGYSPVR